ncbi:hypothetical protein MINTMi27_15360 [Mycobacterium intracellulare]|nr:hypothetical protein MINTMi27_15360 [Mycobacterium intracellulare]
MTQTSSGGSPLAATRINEENDVFKMPRYWSDELGLPNVKEEFLRRQVRYGGEAT